MITRLCQHSSAGSLIGFQDLGHGLQGCQELVSRYYPVVNCQPLQTASNKELIYMFDFCDLWPNQGLNDV